MGASIGRGPTTRTRRIHRKTIPGQHGKNKRFRPPPAQSGAGPGRINLANWHGGRPHGHYLQAGNLIYSAAVPTRIRLSLPYSFFDVMGAMAINNRKAIRVSIPNYILNTQNEHLKCNLHDIKYDDAFGHPGVDYCQRCGNTSTNGGLSNSCCIT